MPRRPARKPTRRRNPSAAERRSAASCSCAVEESHPVAARVTADGIDVLLWSDGAITDRMGSYGVRGKRGADQVEAAMSAGWAVIRNIALYDWSEVPSLARRAYKVALAHPRMTPSSVAARVMET